MTEKEHRLVMAGASYMREAIAAAFAESSHPSAARAAQWAREQVPLPNREITKALTDSVESLD